MAIIAVPPRLLALEKIIEKGEKTFSEVADAIIEIRDTKLYKNEYSNFEEYCLKRWGRTRRWADHLVKSSSTVKQLTEKSENPGSDFVDVPNISEKAARELSKVPKEIRKAVMKAATKNGEITTASVKEAVAKLNGDVKPREGVRGINASFYTSAAAAVADEEEEEGPVITIDGTGHPIPENLMGFWERSDEVQTLLTMLSKVKSAIKKAQDDGDLMYVEVNFTGVIADIEHAYGSIKRAKPYAVCSSCQGKATKSCTLCQGKGLISEMKWGVVPSETKALREKLRK